MKLKAEAVLQFAIVAKAIRQGNLKVEDVVEGILSDVIDRNVGGTQEELDIIKVLAKDVDAGFLAEVLDSILKRFAAKPVQKD